MLLLAVAGWNVFLFVRKLRKADPLQSERAGRRRGLPTFGGVVQTYQRWRSQFQAMRPEGVMRLKALEIRR